MAQAFSDDETRALINDKAATSDNFLIKVHRKPPIGGLLLHVATLADARATHVTYPETWLPRLCGGGNYVIGVYAAEDRTRMIGGYIPCNFDGTPRDVDTHAPRSPGWQGPPTLAFPAEQAAPSLQVITQGGSGNPPHASAANSGVPGGGSPAPVYQSNQIPDWVRQAETNFAVRERELQERERRAREELAAEAHKLREERLRAEFDAKLTQLAKPHEQGGGFDKLVAAIAPIVGQMIQAQEQTRALMMQSQRDAAAQTQDLLKVMLARPAISPEVQLVIDKLVKSDSGSTAEMMSRMVEAMGAISKTSVSMIEAVADVQFQNAPSEHPGLMAIREFSKALSSISRGTAGGAQRVVAGRNGNGTAHAPYGYTLPPSVQAPRVPQATQTTQAAAPSAVAQTPAGAVAAPGPQGFAGVPPSANPLRDDQIDPVVEIVKLIKAEMDPTQVAQVFIVSLQHPTMRAAVEQVEGDLEKLAVQMLGIEWIAAHEAYLRTLVVEIERLGVAAGVIRADGEAANDAEDESNGVASMGHDEAAAPRTTAAEYEEVDAEVDA